MYVWVRADEGITGGGKDEAGESTPGSSRAGPEGVGKERGVCLGQGGSGQRKPG